MVIKRKKVSDSKQRRERRGYYFGDISINDLNKQLKDIIESSEDNKDLQSLIFSVPISMVCALHLCQIRQSLPGLNAQKIEQLASYRHIKKRYTLGSTSPIISAAAIIAAIKCSSFAAVESLEDLYLLASAFIDSFAPNCKVIEGPNSSNYTLWAQGFMARHIGLFGSCPSTNAKAFGFDLNDLKEGTIESLFKKLGPIAENIDVSEVKSILVSAIAVDAGGYDNSILTFSDPEISSPIETEIFATNPEFQFVRSGGTVANSGYTSKGSSEKDLEYLSVMERLVYNQVISVGDKSTIDRLNKKIEKLKSPGDTSPPDGVSLDTSTDGVVKLDSVSNSSATCIKIEKNLFFPWEK
jgi:hypothetical protein